MQHPQSDEVVHLYKVVPKLQSMFDVVSKIGSGTFSNVFLAKLLPKKQIYFALKHILPTSHPDRIQRELGYLYTLKGQNNVVGVESCIRHKGNIVFVMPFIEHQDFSVSIRCLNWKSFIFWSLLLLLVLLVYNCELCFWLCFRSNWVVLC